MRINLDNIKNNDIFHYQLIQISGHLDSTLSHPELPKPQRFDLYLTLNNQKTLQFKINKKFEILVKLEENANNILLECENCKKINLIVKYEILKPFYSVQPLYVVCTDHDGCFQATEANLDNSIQSAKDRIYTGLQLMQTILAKLLYEEATFERHTFSLEPDVKVFQSKLTVAEANRRDAQELWQDIGREIMTSTIASDKLKYVGFLSHTRYKGDSYVEGMSRKQLLDITDGYISLGGGGLALLGTHCLYTWPASCNKIIECFFDESLVDKKSNLDECNLKTFGGCFSFTFGAALHELLHTFGLGHYPKAGIMGIEYPAIRNLFKFKEESRRFKTTNYLTADKCSKEIFLTFGSLSILHYNKWFQQFKICKSVSEVSYCQGQGEIRSVAGLRVVELRKVSNDLLLHSWIFKDFREKFTIDFSVVNKVDGNLSKSALGEVHLFVIDDWGNELKQKIPTSYS